MIFAKKHRSSFLIFILSTLALFIFLFMYVFKKQTFPEKPIVAVITSFNNANWVYKNLDSIFKQDYKNFRVIYLDDCSTDGTADLVRQYIKEKGVAKKVTLIQNKKRSIKILNLYKIHHSLDDWDIIAQIDGDDWLTDDHVFKRVNEAYCKGSWLAYTQFDTTNGYKGSNALPPFWVRWGGTFRTYRPWFMYSHLKTFYAWLFKQIKLQDLFDDHQGVFQPLNDDAYVMYPMLEMACRKFSFIADVCYTFNVDPGYRPQLQGSRNDLFVEQLKKPSYPFLENPTPDRLASLTESVDVVIFAHNNRKSLQRLLDSIKNQVLDVGTIYVLYNADQPVEMKKHYPEKIKLLTYADFSTYLNNISGYVVLADDQSEFLAKVSLKKCMQELEKTFAYGFYFGLDSDIFLSKNNEQGILFQAMYDDICAWKFSCAKSHIPNFNCAMTLYRKKDVLNLFEHVALEKQKALDQWRQAKIDENMVGLFFEKPVIRKATVVA